MVTPKRGSILEVSDLGEAFDRCELTSSHRKDRYVYM